MLPSGRDYYLMLAASELVIVGWEGLWRPSLRCQLLAWLSKNEPRAQSRNGSKSRIWNALV